MRRAVILRCGAAAALLGAVGFAQSRPGAPPAVTVVRAQHASAARARATLAAHLPGIARCLADARAADPAPLAQVRFIDATLALDRSGAAESVQLVPPLLSRGLSACLAESLLNWAQGAPAGPGAVVVLRIANGPAR
jgi:hypothetical protein